MATAEGVGLWPDSLPNMCVCGGNPWRGLVPSVVRLEPTKSSPKRSKTHWNAVRSPPPPLSQCTPPTHCVCCVCWTWRTVNWIEKLKCLLSLQYILMSFRWQNVVLVINFSSCCLSSPALLRCCRLRGCQIHPPSRAQTPPFHHINFIRTTSTHKQPDRYVHSDGEEAVANRSK